MSKNRRIAMRGIFIALAMALSYLESLIPVFYFVPGMKIGLANIITVISLVTLGFKDAVVISLGRILLTSILFGNVTTLAYSVAGAALSLLMMQLVKKIKIFSVTGISVVGGIFHNIGQILVALIILQNAKILYYLIILFITGTVAGVITGIIASLVLKELVTKE